MKVYYSTTTELSRIPAILQILVIDGDVWMRTGFTLTLNHKRFVKMRRWRKNPLLSPMLYKRADGNFKSKIRHGKLELNRITNAQTLSRVGPREVCHD